MLGVAEFFAGIGLVRLGLEQDERFRVLWSNDIERAKQEMYEAHFGPSPDHRYVLGDIADVRGGDLPQVEFAWASFPCTDLSLAGGRSGLRGTESGTFFEWVRILSEMDRRPEVIAAENVSGLATSHGGDDLRTAVRELNQLGYSVDVLAIDSRRFVPQSRQRLFLVGSQSAVAEERSTDSVIRPEWLEFIFADESLQTHRAALPALPPLLAAGFTKSADRLAPGDSSWWGDDRTNAFLASLSPVQSQRLEALRTASTISYRTAYRRTRGGTATWEIRADDIAGCLRTARGGSSKQAVVRAGKGMVRVRWMTPHEYAVLMGAGDYNLAGIRPLQAMFGFGDAVCVPVIAWLAKHYLAPLAAGTLAPERKTVKGA